MAKFRFVLDPLLKVRRLEEERAQRTLAHLEGTRVAIEDTLRTQQQYLVRGKSTLRDSLSGGPIDMDLLRGTAHASMETMRRANQLVIQLAGVHKQIERARLQLAERTRARRAIELLRDRRYTEWRAEIERSEAMVADDLVMAAVARKGTSTCDFSGTP